MLVATPSSACAHIKWFVNVTLLLSQQPTGRPSTQHFAIADLLPLEPIEDYGGARYRHKLRCAIIIVSNPGQDRGAKALLRSKRALAAAYNRLVRTVIVGQGSLSPQQHCGYTLCSCQSAELAFWRLSQSAS